MDPYARGMLRQGPIPQAVQGLLEYLVGALFIAAPFLFDFTGEGVATAASIVLGIAFLVVAATSQAPTGLVKQIPPVVHVLVDVVLAALLIAAPFVLGFSAETTPRNLFLIGGVLWLLVTIASRYGHRDTTAATSAGGRSRNAGPPPSTGPGTPPAGGPVR